MNIKNSDKTAPISYKAKYKRSFWRMHKWTIILTSIPIFIIMVFSFGLILGFDIFRKYESTPVIYHHMESTDSGYFLYSVDGKEYSVKYGKGFLSIGGGYSYNDVKEIWYRSDDPEQVILGRKEGIITVTIGIGVMSVFLIISVIKINIDKNRRNKEKEHWKVNNR